MMSDDCTWTSPQDFFSPDPDVANGENVDPCFEKIQFFSPLGDTPACLQFPAGKRKSMSMTDLTTTDEIASSTDDISCGMVNMKLSPTGRLNHFKSMSKENLSKLAQPKKRYDQACYVPMVEALRKFNTRTPDRFHSKPKNSVFISKPHLLLKVTSPHSPALATKKRTRPRLVLSRDEMETIQAEEMKKFKMKANPINPKVMQGPVSQVTVFKKPSTIIRPFKLTETHQMKKSVSTDSITTKKSFTGSGTVLAPFSFDTRDQQLLKKKQERNTTIVKHTTSTSKPFNASTTELKPFSFEQRDKLIAERRKTMVHKVLEDEKKAREFHAKSPPKYVKDRSRMGSTLSLRSNNDSDAAPKAKPVTRCRPPTVLYQKPFEPKKLEQRTTEVMEFQLSTGRRAKEREDFEQMLKEKDAVIAKLKREQEEQQEIKEQEEVARLRKEREHKAQPVPQFREFNVVPSNLITVAISPKVLARSVKNKENHI